MKPAFYWNALIYLMNTAAGILDSRTHCIVIQAVIHQTQEFDLPTLSAGTISNDVLNVIGKREEDLISQQNWYLTLGKGFTSLSQLSHGNEVEVKVEAIRHTVFVYYACIHW